MSNKDKRVFKKLGYKQSETDKIVKSLNKLLANYHVHYQKLRNFHWNVTGGDFFDLHEKFEELYDEAMENIDLIAERIRVFGYTPYSLITDYLENSDIKEVGTDLSSAEMVNEVLKDFEILAENMNDCAESVGDLGDLATEDMLVAFIKSIELHHWMLTSFQKN
ncbi:DNA starvation/stationary phase protection protein [Litoribacter ruber]|uniref:DNA starvation/stationary phase protection protein n=1 Tax=Litoribacter ruber TaxID=702568 RepID=A0AAP2CFQ5_9BACT|nr:MULTISPECIES: DNA starvation/stationary phase protection protein [Litoribacter]MBS9523157.1 DNA starvation/stationary phase protection protein [Litoribacter alkaliphilus]MBT0810680.1 DNA starvation/stationary phase protection protein [Litoribacter ruber]